MMYFMIKSEGLHFFYDELDNREGTPALFDVIFSIEAGEFIAIVGRNGSGKSTLARHINALLTPTRGTLSVNGMDTKNPTHLWDIRKTAGMVFQNPDNQIVATIVEEDIAFGPENLGLPPSEITQRVQDALSAVGLTAAAKSAPHHLSGGQKQRVAIAGVLAMEPRVLILDESTAMLDPSGRKEVLKTAKQLNKEKGITVLLITHFMEEAIVADRLLVMDKGKLKMEGKPRDIFKRQGELKNLGLTVPQAAVLAETLRNRGLSMPHTILTSEDFTQTMTVQALAKKYKPQPPTLLSPAPKAPIIQLKNVVHIYNEGTPHEKRALLGINLTFSAGEMTAIIGHTGSGKSTLIQHLNALLKPTEGKILFNGNDIHENKKNIKPLRQRVGLVFQYPEHQLFESTVYKDISFGPIRLGLDADEIDTRLKHALATVGLDASLCDKSPFTLSGGQKRRVAIAGVLAMEPEVLILDEPTAGLDPQGREEILAQIKKMHEERGITVILISHSMDDAARLCSRIIVMNQGEIAADGTPTQVFAQQELLKTIHLETPQISQIMSRLSEINPDIPTGIFTVEDAADVLLSGTIENTNILTDEPTEPGALS